MNCVEHLAECASCRKILVNFALTNEMTGTETVLSVSAETEPGENTVLGVPPGVRGVPPGVTWSEWFSNLFALPNLGYAMAALAVLFTGAIGFVVWQNAFNNRSAEVSQVSKQELEKASSDKTASAPLVSEDELDNKLSESSANTASSANTTSNLSTTSANTSTANTNTVAMSNQPTTTLENEELRTPPSVRATKQPTEPLEEQRKREIAEKTPEVVGQTQEDSPGTTPKPVATQPGPTNTVGQNQPVQTTGGERDAEVTRKETADREPKKSKPEDEISKQDDKKLSEKNKDSSTKTEVFSGDYSNGTKPNVTRKVPQPKRAEESRTVGGKTFRKIGGVWIDSAYGTQNTTNVSRGSDEYKKLDSGLRSIAESLGGTVIVVWQGKPYRIQ
jgi:hypothetical protein